MEGVVLLFEDSVINRVQQDDVSWKENCIHEYKYIFFGILCFIGSARRE